MPEVYELMTPAEVANELRVTEKRLTEWRYLKINFHRHVKVGRKVRYVAQELDQYVQDLFDARNPVK